MNLPRVLSWALLMSLPLHLGCDGLREKLESRRITGVKVGPLPEGDPPTALNLLSYVGVPEGAEDWSITPMADAGAWFALGLAPADGDHPMGGFTGPLLLTSGRWVGRQFAGLTLFDVDRGEAIPLESADNRRARSVLGRLAHLFDVGGLELFVDGTFASANTMVITASVSNPGSTPRRLRLGWAGAVFPDQGRLSASTEGVMLELEDRSRLYLDTDRPIAEASSDESRYSLELEGVVELPPGGESEVVSAMLSFFPLNDPPRDDRALDAIIADPRAAVIATLHQWADWEMPLDTAALSEHPASDSIYLALKKSVATLRGNWRAPVGRMRHPALFPSSYVGYFNGFWAWDSWKHAVALARLDPELAAGQVRAMFDHQDESGMIADVVYLDPAEDNWRDTKPPLAGWAIEAVYEAGGDLEFVRELYPKLVAYHRFWYADRDHDGDGLCEYGSTDGTLVAARWESGMDNAVRFDDSAMLENGPRAWSLDQESVDLNSYLYREKKALAKLARALGREDHAAIWDAEAKRVGEWVRGAMWDEATGWFYDVGTLSGEIVPVQGPEGWMPLWAGLATPEQAARVRETMLDPEKFRTAVPFPTVARDHQEFSDGYWRGLVWLDQVYFAIDGLARYGYKEDARELTLQVFENLEGASDYGVPLYENYHPLTGAGQNAPHFSWTAAHLLLLGLDHSGV